MAGWLGLDGVAAFRQAYETTDRTRFLDLLTAIASEGRPVGVPESIGLLSTLSLLPAAAC